MIVINNEFEKATIASFRPDVKKLNILVSDTIKKELNNILDSGCRHLIVDFNNIFFIDSSGFGSLITVYNHAKNQNSYLYLVNINNELLSLFKITKLDQVLHIAQSTKQILDSIN